MITNRRQLQRGISSFMILSKLDLKYYSTLFYYLDANLMMSYEKVQSFVVLIWKDVAISLEWYISYLWVVSVRQLKELGDV